MRAPTDSDLVSRTSSSIAIHSRPAVRDVSGPVVETVECPLCGTATVLRAAFDRVEGRCSGCTVIVRRVGGELRACGWMGGGDMAAAGAAVHDKRPSKYEHEEPAARVRKPAPKKPRKPRALQPCGSDGAWQRHKRNGEPPCVACEKAHRAAENKRRVDRRRKAREAA